MKSSTTCERGSPVISFMDWRERGERVCVDGTVYDIHPPTISYKQSGVVKSSMCPYIGPPEIEGEGGVISLPLTQHQVVKPGQVFAGLLNHLHLQQLYQPCHLWRREGGGGGGNFTDRGVPHQCTVHLISQERMGVHEQSPS